MALKAKEDAKRKARRRSYKGGTGRYKDWGGARPKKATKANSQAQSQAKAARSVRTKRFGRMGSQPQSGVPQRTVRVAGPTYSSTRA